MHVDFTGKTAVVTGGANGIGLAIAHTLADAGALVWIFDLKREHPEECAASMGGHGCAVEVTDPATLESAFARVDQLDVLIANAGTGQAADLLSTSKELWDQTLAVNLSGVFHTVQQGARKMKESGAGGSIVITASTNTFDGEEPYIAYNASKAGLLGIIHTAANELGPYGIRVNAVCPGLIRTRLTEGIFEDRVKIKEYFRHLPLGRGGEAQEVADAAVYLASDRASYITGAALFVDGGQMAAKFGPWKDGQAEFVFDTWRLK
jgi:NAD(P)-dependent dehydrogenase (short-subunit alcohol dehydrogenase family)